jgi:C4-dicarboxylate-specific signal transduction histidine kinase
MIGWPISKLMLSSPREMKVDPVPQVEKIDAQFVEVEGIHKNGSLVPLDVSIAKYFIEDDVYFTYIVRDVSSRKLQEQQDKEHLNQLAHVTRLGLMGEMASGIAHEVNQPLAAVSSYSQVSLNLVNAETPDLVMLSEILYKTQKQALRAGQIIHRMRDFVQSHSKHRSTVAIDTLINDAVSLCVTELKQNDITLTVELDHNLPPIYADHVQIEQVIINLVRNSIDALKQLPLKQTRQLSIISHVTTNKAYIKVEVTDNGPGIDLEQQQKILMPFYTTKTNGMGMGLSISRSLIESHNGSLHFSSQPGKGTTFYFTLPIKEQSDHPG